MARKSPNRTDLHVGSRIRERRMTLGMTQQSLAESLDITFQEVQKYEKGIDRVGAIRLKAMSDILGVPVSFFFDGAPQDASLGRKLQQRTS